MSNNENKKNADSSQTLPCTTIDDLYALQARRTLKRVLETWLTAQRLTVIEFIHSAPALQKFENAGTAYQHAIQRIAVTLAGRTKLPVVQIIRSLTALTTAAMNRVYADERANRFPLLDAAGLFTHAEALADDPARLYLLNGSLAKFLLASDDWDAKLNQVLALYGETRRRGEDGLVLRASEALIVELMADPRVLSELLGPTADFAQRLLGAVRILNGRALEADGMADSLQRLGRHIARGELRDAGLAIADYVRTECAGPKRLRPLSLEEELTAVRNLVEELAAVSSSYLNPADVEEALIARSKRFVTPETLAQLLAGCASPDAKLERILKFEPAIMGTANKRAIGTYALSLVTARHFESDIPAEYKGVPRLHRISQLQARVLRSGFVDAQREEIAASLDRAATRLETEGRYIAGMDTRIADPAERVELYLRLFAAGVFTEGMLAHKVRRALLAALAQPGCASAYAARKDISRQDAIMQLIEQLRGIGITPEEGLSAMKSG